MSPKKKLRRGPKLTGEHPRHLRNLIDQATDEDSRRLLEEFSHELSTEKNNEDEIGSILQGVSWKTIVRRIEHWSHVVRSAPDVPAFTRGEFVDNCKAFATWLRKRQSKLIEHGYSQRAFQDPWLSSLLGLHWPTDLPPLAALIPSAPKERISGAPKLLPEARLNDLVRNRSQLFDAKITIVRLAAQMVDGQAESSEIGDQMSSAIISIFPETNFQDLLACESALTQELYRQTPKSWSRREFKVGGISALLEFTQEVVLSSRTAAYHHARQLVLATGADTYAEALLHSPNRLVNSGIDTVIALWIEELEIMPSVYRQLRSRILQQAQIDKSLPHARTDSSVYFCVDGKSRQYYLLKKNGSVPVELGDKQLSLLLLLWLHRKRGTPVVGVSEIANQLDCEPNRVAPTVHELKDKLGQPKGGPTYIPNIPGKGYRLAGVVMLDDSALSLNVLLEVAVGSVARITKEVLSIQGK